MMNHNGNGKSVPILGPVPEGIKAQVTMFAAMPRCMDENGQFEPEAVVRHPQTGEPVAITGRKSLVDATDLVEMIEEMTRRVVKEEIAAALKERT